MGAEIEYPLGYASSGDTLLRDTGVGSATDSRQLLDSIVHSSFLCGALIKI